MCRVPAGTLTSKPIMVYAGILTNIRGIQKIVDWVDDSQCLPGCVIRQLSACTHVPYRNGGPLIFNATIRISPP